MKKVIIPMLGLMFFISSCAPDPNQGPVQAPEIDHALADAQASALFIKKYHESLDVIELFNGSIAAGAEASAANHYKTTFGLGSNPSQASLPMNLELEINPLESIGRYHNLTLNGIFELGGYSKTYVGFVTYDTTIWRPLLFKNPGITTTAQTDSLTNHLKQLNYNDYFQEKLEELKDKMSNEEIAEWVGLDKVHEEFMENVLNNYTRMKDKHSTVTEVSTYLNDKIKEAITTLFEGEVWTTDDYSLLEFLTVLKHSDCYWREN